MGKWMGFTAMVAAYVAIMFGGTIAEGYGIGHVMAQHPVRGALLIFLECMIALSVTFMFGTWFSTLTSGVIVLGLLGVAFLGGWLEQLSGFTEGSRLAMVGIVSSLIMPSEAVWRRAAFEMESPLAGSLQFSPFADVSIPSLAMIGYAQLCDVPRVSKSPNYADEARYERLPPGEGELPLREFVRVLPSDLIVGLEIPMLARAEQGIGPLERLADCVRRACDLRASSTA